MGIPYRRLMEAVRFLLLFTTCTLLCYGLISLLSGRLLPANPYRQPHGNAVKVVKVLQEPPADDVSWYRERLQLFYLTGE